MESMDYTMDEAGNHGNHGNQGNNAASRHPCQQSSPAAQNGFSSSQNRPGSHFDPVHEASSTYYYGFSGNVPGPFTYSTPYMRQMQHWPPPPSMPGSWHSFGDMPRTNPSQGGVGRNYGDMSWSTSQGFGGPEDAYGPFASQLSGHNLSPDNTLAPGGTNIGGSAGQTSPLRPGSFALGSDQQIPDLPSPPSQRRIPSLGSGRANRLQPPSHSFPEPPPYLRYHRAPRASPSRPALTGNGAVGRQSWADSDEESISDLENEAIRREMASYRESDEEHVLIMQGAMAAGRRLLAKEAFDSLEKVKVEDLPKESRDCTICYNDFGVKNPDGVVEHPVRWPKCKHLFGAMCIKRWFDEGKDTCPYCREKIPSELAAKRLGMESQMRMLQRRRMMQATSIAQHQARLNMSQPVGFFPEETSSGRTPTTPFSRSQDEYEAYMMNRHPENWSASSPNRYSPGDSPERRRQGRGRVGTGRSGHIMGRPVSVGSARSVSQPFNIHHNPPQRGFGPPVPSLQNLASTRRLNTPAQGRDVPTQPQTLQNQPSASLPGSISASPDAASPPVAIGSGLPAQHRINVDTTSNFPRHTTSTMDGQR